MGNGPADQLDGEFHGGDSVADLGIQPGPAASPSDAPASARRGPGRPPGKSGKSGKPGGASQKAGRGADSESLRLRVDEAPRAAKPSRPDKPVAKAKVGDDGDAQQAATALLQLVEMGGLVMVGPAGGMSPIERGMVEPALVRTLARMDAGAIAKYGALADPIVLCLGLGMWSMRLLAIRKAQSAAAETANRAQSSGAAAPAESPGPGAAMAAQPPDDPAVHQAPASGEQNGYAPVPPLISLAVDGDLGPID